MDKIDIWKTDNYENLNLDDLLVLKEKMQALVYGNDRYRHDCWQIYFKVCSAVRNRLRVYKNK